MPNYVYNKLIVHGKVDLERFMTDGKFDFNKIIKRPEIYDKTVAGSVIDIGLKCLYETAKQDAKKGIKPTENILKMNKLNEVYQHISSFNVGQTLDEYKAPKYIEEATKSAELTVEAYETYGYTDWYTWNIEHWDTKWNALDTDYFDDTIYFTTAWSMPEKIIVELSKILQGIECEIYWADEGISENVGHATYVNGVVKKGGYLKPGSKEWIETKEELGVMIYDDDDES